MELLLVYLQMWCFSTSKASATGIRWASQPVAKVVVSGAASCSAEPSVSRLVPWRLRFVRPSQLREKFIISSWLFGIASHTSNKRDWSLALLCPHVYGTGGSGHHSEENLRMVWDCCLVAQFILKHRWCCQVIRVYISFIKTPLLLSKQGVPNWWLSSRLVWGERAS